MIATIERETKRSRVLEALPANKKARTVSYPGARANNNFNQIKNRPNPAAVKVAPKAGMNLLQLSKLQAKKKKGHLWAVHPCKICVKCKKLIIIYK